jgi:Tol biopolymer transport system component
MLVKPTALHRNLMLALLLPSLGAGCASGPATPAWTNASAAPIDAAEPAASAAAGPTVGMLDPWMPEVGLDAPPARSDPRRSIPVSLYGDELIAGHHPNVATPYDGSGNVAQLTFATEGATFDPDVDRSGRIIVFASTRHSPTADIYLKSATGSTTTQLTSDPGNDIMPAIDPGGQYVAFASDRSGNWDVYYQPIAGGQAVQVTRSFEHELHPTWSPDGRTLCFCKYGARTGRWELWVVDVENPSTPSFLTFGVFPQWSPDVANNRILFQRARQRGSRFHSIWTIDYVNGEARRPTELVSAGNAALINPSWSPDGRRIVFTTVAEPDGQPERPTISDIWAMNVDGSGRVNLTNGRFGNYQPVWSPDGTILFVSNRSGVDNLWAVTAGAPEGTPAMATVDESSADRQP